MGMSADGILAYGFDLGGDESWNIRSVQKFEEWRPAWLTAEQLAELDEGDLDLQYAIEERLVSVSLDGVQAVDYGRLDVEGGRGYLLVAWSATCLTQPVVEVAPQDLLERRAIERWDARLAGALKALEIEPWQPNPSWLLTASWG